MKIISHRGYWKTLAEKNTLAAFLRSFQSGFGIETDLRDLAGTLVISHDPPETNALAATTLLDAHRRHGSQLTLALNIKSDGLQSRVVEHLHESCDIDVFVFDMTVPDAMQWLKTAIPVFTRHSDVEPHPALYAEASGVWLDAFRSDWWDSDTVARHLDTGKRVCIVSPELHRREHRRVWDRLSAMELPTTNDIMICTDFPEEAEAAFNHVD